MKIYCRKCGAPTEYISARPKFCSSCGLSVSASEEKAKQQPEKPKPKRKDPIAAIEIETEDFPEEGGVPSGMDGLDVEIRTSEAHGIKFGDILGSSEGSERFQREPDEQVPREQFLKEFKREAGSIRNSAPEKD
jgi:ribosomal protein L37E